MKRELGNESLVLVLVRFSLPLILSGMLQQLYNWADAFIVGNVEGELALAAIGATGTVVNFYIMAMTGFTMGLSILFAHKYGGGETDIIHRILSTFVMIVGCAFLAFTVAGMFFTSPLLSLLNTPGDITGLAKTYLRIIFIGIPFLAVYNVYFAALRAIGDSKAPFWAILFSSVTNVLLDILFVAVLRWGVEGAAAATVVSQILMMVFIICYTIKKHPMLRFRFDRHMMDMATIKEGFRLGMPPMIQSSVGAFGSLFLQNFMNGFGTQTVAAITTAYRVDTIILLPIINLGSAIATMVAQANGARDKERIRKFFKIGTLLMIGISLALTVLVIPTGGYLISMFGVEAEAARIGRDFFQRIAAFYVIYGLSMAVRGVLEGVGDVTFSSIAGILSLIARIIMSYTLVAFSGNMIIAYAEGLSWLLLLLLYLGRYMVKRRELQ